MATAKISVDLESPMPGTTARMEFSFQKGRRTVEWKLTLNNVASQSELAGTSIDQARSLVIWLERSLDQGTANRPAEPAGFITKPEGALRLAVRDSLGVSEAGVSSAQEARAVVAAIRSLVEWAVVA